MRSAKISVNTLIEYLIYLYIFIVMINSNTGAMAVKVIRVILAGAFVFYFPRAKGIKSSAYVTWAIIFIIYNIVMTQFAAYKSYAVEYTKTLLYVLIVNIGICFYISKSDITIGMIKAFVVGTIAEAVSTFGKYGFLVFLNARSTEEGSANILGFYAAMAFIFSFMLSKNENERKHKKLYILVCGMCLVIILLSASRKAVMYAVVPLVAYWILRSANLVKTFRNVLLSAVIVTIAYYVLMHVSFAYNLLGHRIESMIAGFLGESADSSTTTRLNLIEAGMSWFRQKPWFGYGLSNYKALNWAIRRSAYYAHNNYVELLVDCGIVGTALYYLLHLNIIAQTVKSKMLDRVAKGFLLGIIFCLLIGDYGMVSYNDAIFQLILMLLYMAASGCVKLFNINDLSEAKA